MGKEKQSNKSLIPNKYENDNTKKNVAQLLQGN